MNFVFDLGGVVVDWNPKRILAPFGLGATEQIRMHSALFGHPSWLDFDRGAITLPEVVAGAADRGGYDRSLVDRIVRSVPDSLSPFDEMVELIRAIDRSRHAIYCMSNMSQPSYEHLKHVLPWDDLFDGMIISCLEGLAKPDRRIYDLLLDRYELIADETYFFDDVDVNIESARSAGIRGLLYTGVAECRSQLEATGAFVSS